MAIHLIGRQKEKTQLRDISESTTARFVGIWGRRRVGKTFLIDTYFQNQPSLKVVGKYKASKSDQLDLFRIALQKAFFDGASLPKFTSWAHCFEVLVACLKKHKHENFVVFLDEVPWLAGKSTNEFLGALDHSWNTELCHISHLRFIVCGSAASWMIKNFSKAKGGLHNRLTDSIHLFPFSLKETEEFFHSRGFSYSRKTVLESYLCFGGVPYYLSLMRPRAAPEKMSGKLTIVEVLDKKNPLVVHQRIFLTQTHIAVCLEIHLSKDEDRVHRRYHDRRRRRCHGNRDCRRLRRRRIRLHGVPLVELHLQ